jgi:hypothetical protein
MKIVKARFAGKGLLLCLLGFWSWREGVTWHARWQRPFQGLTMVYTLRQQPGPVWPFWLLFIRTWCCSKSKTRLIGVYFARSEPNPVSL